MTELVHPTFPPARFSMEEAINAGTAWGANCGPGALAAILNRTLADVRPHLGDFERKHYTNPTLMFDALDSLGARWRKTARERFDSLLGWPVDGLARVQWEGPWTKPGVPARVAYMHTHWVAARHDAGTVFVFDINCMSVGGWVTADVWSELVVPWLLKECEPKADGRWHITHAVEIERVPA